MDSIEEQVRAIDVLSHDDARAMIYERILFERLKFTLNSDGSVTSDRLGGEE
jgi:hypothetical protein